jgi:hypothetical protein
MSERERGRVEVREAVGNDDGVPYVQMRVVDGEGNVLNAWALELQEAWMMAQRIEEAVLNAIIACHNDEAGGVVDWQKLFMSQDHGEQ